MKNPTPLTNSEKALINWIDKKGHKWARLNHAKEYELLVRRGLIKDKTMPKFTSKELNRNGRTVGIVRIETPTGLKIFIKENYNR